MNARSCPHCNENIPNQSAVAIKGARAKRIPTDGDISLCIKCGEVSIFANNGQDLRLPTSKEMEDLPKMAHDAMGFIKTRIKTQLN